MVMTRENVQTLIAEGHSIDAIAEQLTAQYARLWQPTAFDAEQNRKLVWTLADLDGYHAASQGKRRWG